MNEPTQPTPTQSPVIRESLSAPTVTYVLLGTTILIYLLQVLTNVFTGYDIPALLARKDNAAILQGEYWRFLTPMLLHGSIYHIGFNMYALVVIGSELEKRFGHWRFLLLYTLGSLGGNVISFIFSPNPSLGASTSIFGLLGAEIVFFYQNRQLFGSGARKALQNIITVAVINLIIGLSPGIDNWGHMGGLVAGLIFSWFGGPKLKINGYYPYFDVIDERKPADAALGAVLVILLFCSAAALKIIGAA